jgi:tetratricopeptide (TPR) repeat protein
MKAETITTHDLPLSQRGFLLLLGFRHIQTGRMTEALAIYEVLQVLLPKDIKISQALIYVYLKIGQLDCALKELEKLNNPLNSDSVTWLLRGQTLSRLGRTAEAAKAMRMYIRLRNTKTTFESL